ncbi:MAG: DUF502 domain-containing protein [Gammaproteobacteria bacterium]|nr:DUF502 domain-containing protein [Gammaproteobacteria bacterium]
MKRLKTSLRKYFFTGLLVIVPISVTGYAIWFLLKAMDAILRYVPARYLPETYLHIHIPGLGLILVVFLVFAVGLLTRNFVGRKMVHLGEKIVDRIPLARIIYVGVKQLLEALFFQKTKAFDKAALIEYPRRGIYAICFITGESKGEVQCKTNKNMINVFVPTTPNPTSGFYILIPENELIILNMSVEDAFKLIVSGGIVSPNEAKNSQ